MDNLITAPELLASSATDVGEIRSAITDATVYAQGSESNPSGYATADGEDVGAIDESDSSVAFSVTAPTSGTYYLQIYYGNETGTMAH